MGITPKKKKCKRCQELKYLYARGMCKNCDAIENSHKHSSPKKSYSKTTRKSVSKKSAKQKNIDKELAKVYTEIKEERDPICQGCGTHLYLSFSHIIRRSKIRHLIAEKDNIQIHCQDYGEHKGCHQKWESMDIHQMMELNDFDRNLKYLKDNDAELYNKLLLLMEDAGLK